MYNIFLHLMGQENKHVPKQKIRKAGRPSLKWITNEIKQLLINPYLKPVSVEHLIALLTFLCFNTPLTPRMYSA